MADNFLSKTRVTPEDFVQSDGRPVLERYGELRALLSDRAGPEVAALFAEPLISRGNDEAPPTVSWYGEGEAEARPLSKLSPAARDRAEAYLADHLRPLRALAEDPATADLALGALTVYGKDDVMVVGDRPVITNWGLMPGGNGAHAGLRSVHYAETLGRYLPLSVAATPATAAQPGPPPSSAPSPEPSAQPATAASGAVASSATGAARAAPPPLPVAAARGIPALAWVPLLVLLLLAALALAWILLPGNRLYPASMSQPVITDQAALDAARALNQSLRERKAALEAALQGAVCRPDGILILPDGRTPEGLLPPARGVPPEDKAEAVPDSLLPTNPERVMVPDPEGEPEPGGVMPQTTLLDVIEQRTVLVLAAHPKGMATGSGFFVGPGLIVTNSHVIESPASADELKVIVTGAGLDKPYRATVLKTAGPLEDTGADFALLKINHDGVTPFTVHLGSGSLKLTNVIAAGYPADVLETDFNFAALQSGDLSAVPELTVTDGTINTEQQMGPETHVLMHSAPLSSGNSGGPLVDMCGRVVGVNTFVRQGRMQNRGFALAAADMLAFLEGTAAAPQVVSEPCAPVVARARPAPAPDAAAPEADAPGAAEPAEE